MNRTSLLLRANLAGALLLLAPRGAQGAEAPKPIEVKVAQPTRGEIAELAKYKAELRVAEPDYERVSAAQKKAPDLVTPQSVDEARGRLEVAQANLERTETLLKYAHITAPFSGIVTARFVDPGAFIPSATSGSAAQTAAIVTIADFNTVRAQVALPEVEASLAQVGQPVKVTVEGLAGKTFDAKISRLSYALDEATRTMLVEADLRNPELVLRPSMYAMVRVGVEKHTDALLLPVDALVMEKANASVFIAESGKAKKKAVQLGFNDGAKVEILGGLMGNEQIILVGKLTLVDGAPISVVEGK